MFVLFFTLDTCCNAQKVSYNNHWVTFLPSLLTGGEFKLPGVMRQWTMCFDRKCLMVSPDCLCIVVVAVSDRQLTVTHDTHCVIKDLTWCWPRITKIFCAPVSVRQTVWITGDYGKEYNYGLSRKHVAAECWLSEFNRWRNVVRVRGLTSTSSLMQPVTTASCWMGQMRPLIT